MSLTSAAITDWKLDWNALHASFDTKITKNLTPLVRFAWFFYDQIFFQKFERTYGHLVQKGTFNFLKDSLVIKLSGKMYQGVSFLVITSM